MSFRSGAVVLGAVDQVYSRPEAFEGLTADPVKTVHRALPDAAPGLVELWPLIAPAERQARSKAGTRRSTPRASKPARASWRANRRARRRAGWRAGSKAGDVLVLVRQRGPLFEAVIRALKNAGIPVAGADRLVLTEHIAVMDLMALADCLLLPDDDLALASVLRSPLFGLSDAQLFDVAFDRKGSLRASLRAKASNDPVFAEANSALDDLARQRATSRPFGFFAHVLGALRGRAKFLARLGLEANDALDEFLNLALDYERARDARRCKASSPGCARRKSEVKRDMEMVRDEVRVMTVHGAKGLEAHTVILADTTTPPTGPRDPRLLALDTGALVWAMRAATTSAR